MQVGQKMVPMKEESETSKEFEEEHDVLSRGVADARSEGESFVARERRSGTMFSLPGAVDDLYCEFILIQPLCTAKE